MQLSHYEWVDEIHLFNVFKTRIGDKLSQTGPNEYAHTSVVSGEVSNLTISDMAIADFKDKGYLKLIKTTGETTEENFDMVKPFVLHADKQEAQNPGTVPVNLKPESVEIIKIDKPQEPIKKTAKESVEVIKMEKPVKREVVVTEHHAPITAEPEVERPEPQILTALLDGVLQDSSSLENDVVAKTVKKVNRGPRAKKADTAKAPSKKGK